MGLSRRGENRRGWIRVKCPQNKILASFDEKLILGGDQEFRIGDGDAIILKREHTAPPKGWSIWGLFWRFYHPKLRSRYGDKTAVKESLILQHDRQRTPLACAYKPNSGIHIAARQLAEGFGISLIDETGTKALKIYYGQNSPDMAQMVAEKPHVLLSSHTLVKKYLLQTRSFGVELKLNLLKASQGTNSHHSATSTASAMGALNLLTWYLIYLWWYLSEISRVHTIKEPFAKLPLRAQIILSLPLFILPFFLFDFHSKGKILIEKGVIKVGGWFVFRRFVYKTLKFSDFQYISITECMGPRIELIGDRRRFLFPKQFTSDGSGIKRDRLKEVLESAISHFCA